MAQTRKYIRLAVDLQTDSIVDGPGLRAVLWTQGCSHHCKGCQNAQTWDFNGGGLVPLKMVYDAIDELEYQDGITFSGGDPMFQPEACNEIAKYAISKGYNIWCYTGFTYEKLLELSLEKPIYKEFLSNIDVLIDGPFILNKKSLDCIFRGSTNQRLIDTKKSLITGNVEIVTKYDKNKNNEKKECIFI